MDDDLSDGDDAYDINIIPPELDNLTDKYKDGIEKFPKKSEFHSLTFFGITIATWGV